MKSADDVGIRMPRCPAPCRFGSPRLRLTIVVLAIGAASHFLLYLDSVVDNLLPAAMPYLLNVYQDKETADLAWEIMVSSRIYGLALGCFVSIFLASRSGRKYSIVLGTGLGLLGVFFTMFTTYLPFGLSAAILGRFINGCGQGIVQTAGSVMIAEIAPTRIRGTVLASLTMWACMGELSGMIISLDDVLGTPAHWPIAMAFPLLLLGPALVVLCFAPESPRYLYQVNRENEAMKAMLFYQSTSDSKVSTEEMYAEVQFFLLVRDENGNPTQKERRQTSFSDFFQRLQDGQFSRPLLIAMFLQSFVHLDDWLWISYSTQIFENYGQTMRNAQRSSLVMSLPQAVVSLALLGCFDNFKRRTLLIVPTAVSAFLGVIAIIFLSFPGALLQGFPVGILLPIVASFDLSTAAISGESAFAIVPELFLSQDKIIGTAIVGISQNIFGGILTNILLTALNTVGTANVLVPFVVMNIVYVAVNYRCLPETAEKTAEEVAQNFSRDPPCRPLFVWLQRIIARLSPVQQRSPGTNAILIFVAQVILCIFLIKISVELFESITYLFA